MNVNEELINEIVRRILSAPPLQGLLQVDKEKNTAVKQNGLVLLNFVPDFERVLTTVKTRWGAEYTLDILPSESVLQAKPDLPEGMKWIAPQDAWSKDWQKIMIPACSLNTLAKAALGLRDNPLCEMIGRGISKGKPIELVTEYLGLTAQTPSAYRDLYEGYLQKVQSYGVHVFAAIEDECSLSNQKLSLANSEMRDVPPEVIPNVIRYEKKLLADKDAYGFPEEAIVMVKQLTVVSPLARDTLRLRRIELRQEREEGRR